MDKDQNGPMITRATQTFLFFQPTHIARLCWINRSTKSVPKETQGAKNESRYSDCTGGLQWGEITMPRNALGHAGRGDHAKRRNQYQTEFFVHVYDPPIFGAGLAKTTPGVVD